MAAASALAATKVTLTKGTQNLLITRRVTATVARSSTSWVFIRRNGTKTQRSTTTTTTTTTTTKMEKSTVETFCADMAAKQPTPGGGAAAAIGAAVGSAAASMAAAYTTRKKDKESGAAALAETLIGKLDIAPMLAKANEDAAAYANLQRTWKGSVPADEKAEIEAKALAVPVELLEECHSRIKAIMDFLPSCNPNITSDAKVGVHQLAGAARAAYQTVLVNSPPEELKLKLKGLLQEIREAEDSLL